MKHYIATNEVDGARIEYDASQPDPAHLLPPWRLEEVADAAPALDAPPTPPEPIRITKLAFRNRFSQAEKAAIEMAALDNPSASMQQRQFAAALRAQLADQRDATHIDLSRADTRAGVQSLETTGLIASGRATVILDTPPSETEAWYGN